MHSLSGGFDGRFLVIMVLAIIVLIVIVLIVMVLAITKAHQKPINKKAC